MNKTQIYVAVQRIIKQLLGLADGYIRLDSQNAPIANNQDYAIISINSIRGRSWRDSVMVANPPDPNPLVPTDFTETITQNAIECNLVVKFYGQNADDYVAELPLRLQSNQARGLFKTFNLGYSGCSQLNLDESLFNESFVRFSAIEIKIYTSRELTTTVNEMNQFTIDGTIDNNQLNITLP